MQDSLTDASVLVTGGAGFIGSHLVDALVSDNDVAVLDDLSTGESERLPESARLLVDDVRNRERVTDAIAGTDIVFHHAGLVSVAQSTETPYASHTTNATGTVNVLDAAREPDTRVVFASSAAIYGHPEYTPIDERHPKDPTSPYGLDKLTADHYTRLYHDLYDLDTVALRYFNVYGPGQTGGDYAGVISVFIEQALAGEDITVHGEGDQTRDFVYVDDVVRANRKAALTEHVGRAYNVGSGDSVSIRELAELIREITDSDSEIVHVESRTGDVERSEADISRARRRLEYEPTVSIREGLERTVEWYRATRS